MLEWGFFFFGLNDILRGSTSHVVNGYAYSIIRSGDFTSAIKAFNFGGVWGILMASASFY